MNRHSTRVAFFREVGLGGVKVLVASIAVALSSQYALACGGADGGARTAARVASTSTGAPAVASATDATRRYLNDGDNDPSNDNDPDNNLPDDDNDAPEDNTHPGNGRYHDKDDNIAVYGPSASTADKRTIAALVKRYYAVAAAGDGGKACGMLYSVLATAVPEDFGRPPGPAYLRGKTCAAVMVRVFAHSRAKLKGTFAVTDVRVKGNHAFVLLGSKTMPASGMFMHREHGVWKIASLLGNPLG